ncbi:MAG: hypothetical protein H0W64_06230 [Gammaproteobacteria bacterium]|nr:hypothetical protein [Gammaproteobacteria bacterium]
MQRFVSVVVTVICSFPLVALAGWQVAKPDSAIPREPFFQTGVQPKTAFIPVAYSSTKFPNQYAKLGQPAAVYAVSISGSLKENLERIMGRYHWRVIWKAPFDYNFDGRVTGASLPNVVEKLLEPFPLQAIMYMSNRTVTVVPRAKLGTK